MTRAGLMMDSPEGLAAIAGIFGAALGAIGVMVAGFFKARSDTTVGLTQAQAKMLTDAWEQIQVQRVQIDNLDKKILEERRACDRKLSRLHAKIEALSD